MRPAVVAAHHRREMPPTTAGPPRHAFGGAAAPISGALPHRKRIGAGRLRSLIGLDLGTSHSCVAVVGAAGVEVVRDAQGNGSVPSAIAITEDDELLVGWEAVGDRASRENRFYSFKRLMGQRASDVLEEASRLLYTVAEGDRGEALVYSPAADDLLTPEELSGWVLRHLAQRAERHTRAAVTGAVIAVPAHFGRQQKAATLEAAAQAGLRQVHLLQEPVAAALAYGIGGAADGETVLVFDVGGGTFDVSLLQAFEGILEVLGTGGDSRLGGDDFDAALAGWITAQLGPGCGRAWAAGAAEAAKIALSSAPATTIIAQDGRALELTEATFEEVTAHLFQRMAEPLAQLGREHFVEWAAAPEDAAPGDARAASASASASTTPSGAPGTPPGSGAAAPGAPERQRREDKWAPPPRRVTRVALVGQVTRLPSVRRFVERLTGVEPCCSVDPGEAVALGAAIQAGVLEGSVGQVELMDGSFVADLHERVAGFGQWQA